MKNPDFTDFISSLNSKYDLAYEAYLVGDYATESSLIDQGVGMKEAFLLIFGDDYKIVMKDSQGKSNHVVIRKQESI